MKQLAIIGMGPRGLYALENLLMQLDHLKKQVYILIFEETNQPGAGIIWHTNQPDTNWINTTERGLDRVKGRPKINYNNLIIEGFPSYLEWSQFSQSEIEPDLFPARHKLGKYLNERYQSIHKILENSANFKFINSKVLNIDFEHNELKITTDYSTWICDDVLLTIGNQDVELSEELKQWISHSKTADSLYVFKDAYPVSQLDSIKNKTDLSIGIRGFGLTMIDVMRYLMINNYGNFKVTNPNTFETFYYKVKEQNIKLIPFSLYGLPLVPKPLNKQIDNWYKPTAEELHAFESAINSVVQTKTQIDSLSFLTDAFAQITARVFMDLNEKALAHTLDKSDIKSIILYLLDDIDYRHQLLQDESISTYKLIQIYIEMALGELPISLDYCIGQVWRHCQRSLYHTFSHAHIDVKIIEAIIALNERSKRYSFGPPIESMQQILALVDANILDLDYVKDPKIETVKEGWLITNTEHTSVLCPIMINSVLDEPILLKTNTPLINHLLKNELIEPLLPELGIKTTSNAYVTTTKTERKTPIAVLGRMAKGSVLGVDSISECFGPRTEDWAINYVQKLNS